MGLFHTTIEAAELFVKKGNQKKAAEKFEKAARKEPHSYIRKILEYSLTGQCYICESGAYAIGKYYDMSEFRSDANAAEWCRYGLEKAAKAPDKYWRAIRMYRFTLAVAAETEAERLKYLRESIFEHRDPDTAYYAMCHNMIDKVCKTVDEKAQLYATVITGRTILTEVEDRHGHYIEHTGYEAWMYEQLDRCRENRRIEHAMDALKKMGTAKGKDAAETKKAAEAALREVAKAQQQNQERLRELQESLLSIYGMAQNEAGMKIKDARTGEKLHLEDDGTFRVVDEWPDD